MRMVHECSRAPGFFLLKSRSTVTKFVSEEGVECRSFGVLDDRRLIINLILIFTQTRFFLSLSFDFLIVRREI